MGCESVIYDESDRVEIMMQNADAFAQMRNTVLLNNLNDLFIFCFEEMRDFSVEGFDNLYTALNKYFDCLEKTAVLVKDKREPFRREFADIVCEQIDILYRGTRNTGSDHVFLRRIGIKDGFYSFETVREEIEKLIGHGEKDDLMRLFEEDTATDKFCYTDLIALEKQRGQSEKIDDSFETFDSDELKINSVMPSSLDMKERGAVVGVRSVLLNTRLKLAIATGALVAIGGAVALAQQYTGFDKAESIADKEQPQNGNQTNELRSSVSNASIVDENQSVGNRKEVFVFCRLDRDAESYKSYIARLEDGSPRVFMSNFKNAAGRAQVQTSTADIESVRRDLFNAFLGEMSVYEDDKLTQQFVGVHSRNFNSYNGLAWQDGAKQTALIYKAIEPDCE